LNLLFRSCCSVYVLSLLLFFFVLLPLRSML
jgi:hypothetical protein